MLRWVAAIALMGGLTLSAFASANPGYFGKTDVFASARSFSHVTADGARWDDRAGGFRLLDDPAGGYRKDGTVTSEPLHYGFRFGKVVPSWNADCPAGTWVRVDLQTSDDGGDTWTVWYELALWGDADALARIPANGMVRQDNKGRVNEDTLELARMANRLRYRVVLHTDRPEVTPVVSLVAIAVQNPEREVEPDDTPGPAWGVEVPAEFRSQLVENGDISWRICGPTSTAMALAAHGVSLPTADVAHAAWDSLNGIYGNWPYLAAAGSRLLREYADRIPPAEGRHKAFQSYVLWCADWKDVEAEILRGNPVVVSISFGKGELDGAPYDRTDGHLILVRGFTKTGDVVCNDPNARKETDGRVVYKRWQLHNARHRGPVIVFHPFE